MFLPFWQISPIIEDFNVTSNSLRKRTYISWHICSNGKSTYCKHLLKKKKGKLHKRHLFFFNLSHLHNIILKCILHGQSGFVSPLKNNISIILKYGKGQEFSYFSFYLYDKEKMFFSLTSSGAHRNCHSN